jgi:ABC-type transport system involved in multi-copper enzyme maturation permease subunit
MKTKNVKALLAKDFRMSGWVFLVGVLMWPAPIVFTSLLAYMLTDPSRVRSLLWWRTMSGFPACVMLSMIMISMVISHLLTSERMDRSVSFLSYLPFKRSEALISKIVNAAAFMTVFIILDGLFLGYMNPQGHTEQLVLGIFLLACGAMLIFGSAWLAGACLRSSAMTTAMGVGVPVMVWVGVGSQCDRENIFPAIVAVSLVLGVVFFVAGSIVFVKRGPEA